MSKIIFDSGISLDGFFAGDNRSPGNPIGGVSGKFTSGCLNKKHFGNNKWDICPALPKMMGMDLITRITIIE